MAVVLGERGAVAVSVLVAVAALGAIDGCIFTGSRAVYAWGNDYPAFRLFGRWNGRVGAPVAALVAQGGIAMLLILLPGMSKALAGILGSGLQSAAEYTAPVFWYFLFLMGVAVFVLRFKYPTAKRPLGKWFGLVMGAVLCVTSTYMFHSSVVYTQGGALVGLGVLLAGLPVYVVALVYQRK
ncbi:MAG: APC family permease, partial [bacterium]|nr:APC family permease [bacterium]